MNPLDVYKKLPRKNCGKCSAGTCMAFAVQFLRRMVSISECPEIDEQTKKEIEVMLSAPGDWKERRLLELFQEIFNPPGPPFIKGELGGIAEIAEGIGASVEKDSFKIRYLGKEIMVGPSGFNEELNIMDKLLILMYIKTAGSKTLTGEWVAFRNLKDGLIRSESFHEACELSLAKMYGKNHEGLLQKMIAMGAQEAKGFSAAHSFIIYPLPKIPFLVLLWPGDEEFEPDCKMLFDSTVTEYIDVEALLYLGMALVRAISS
ncbi:MAG: DUF3786 domain-containing protein [Nitrospirae bacterium]|nr:DUF3786 domain-containing protein [Nitrospirota bacterium]